MKKRLYLLIILCLMPLPAQSKGVYLTLEEFQSIAFAEQTPEVKKYWLSAEDRKIGEDILLHSYNGLRVRYWQHEERTAWIFNEIGKTEPITIGIIVEGEQPAKIVSVHILEFRESRGWEVKYPFFLEQFDQLSLDNKHRLTDNIDNVTGATLSVRAVTKSARWALYLHGQQAKQ